MSSVLRPFLNDILFRVDKGRISDNFVVVYFDDIIIYSKGKEEHWRHVKKGLKKIQEARINLKITKCEFVVKVTELLGHIINGETTRMQLEKVKAILEWPTPVNHEGVAGCRGLTGYYRQYVERFSDRMRTTERSTRKKRIRMDRKKRKSISRH